MKKSLNFLTRKNRILFNTPLRSISVFAKIFSKSLIIIGIVITFSSPSFGARLKDMTQIKGVRENLLLGYGLVAGLNGTGDKAGADFTLQSIVNMLEKQGVLIDKNSLTVKNVAAVMLTAKLPAFARKGSTIDVVVSAIGDAKSIQGGTLIMTPLLGPDGRVYAVAQGPLSVGGFAIEGESAQIQKNHPTVGRISGGAIIEREISFDISKKRGFTLVLKNPDFTTASDISREINLAIGAGTASASDSATVKITFPESYQKGMVEMIAKIEKLEVTPDLPAKIILDERTGTVVIGQNITISTVAISHGNLSITVKETPLVSQPSPLSSGETVVASDTSIEVVEKKEKLILLNGGVGLADMISALNAIGATPRDLISILQAIKAAGALQAELEVI